MADWLNNVWNSANNARKSDRKRRRREQRRRQLRSHVESLEARRLLAADSVSVEETQLLAEHAQGLWEATGLAPEQVQALENLRYEVADLGEHKLASYQSGKITIDDNAAGHLWFVDQTPLLNEEFTEVDGTLTANAATLATGKIDLLTAILHEQGHALGLHGSIGTHDVMNDALQVGLRRLPTIDQADDAVAGSINTVEFLTSTVTGSGQEINNLMPYGTVNYLVALQGSLPIRQSNRRRADDRIGRNVCGQLRATRLRTCTWPVVRHHRRTKRCFPSWERLMAVMARRRLVCPIFVAVYRLVPVRGRHWTTTFLDKQAASNPTHWVPIN